MAEEAGSNHGLVHYYFGSIEQLLVRVLERFTERLIERQRQMYAADIPFLEKWRTAMRYLDEDRAYQKIWLELQALCWNRPELHERLVQVHGVYTFNEGIMLERLCGIETGHHELLEWIERWLRQREEAM